jgi:hypothetical protein
LHVVSIKHEFFCLFCFNFGGESALRECGFWVAGSGFWCSTALVLKNLSILREVLGFWRCNIALGEGVLHTLWLARDLGLNLIVVEGDCVPLFYSLQSLEPCFTPFGDLVQDIKWASRSLSDVSFTCVHPLCNHAGHDLAKEALLSCNSQIWDELS